MIQPPSPLRGTSSDLPQLSFRPHRDLHDVELLALLLRTSGRQQGSALEQAQRCLKGFQDLRSLERAGTGEIAEIAQLPYEKASSIKAALELGRRLAGQPLSRGEAYLCSRQIWRAYGPKLAGHEQETFWALLLDQGNRLLREIQVSKGSVNRCPVTPAEIFAPALREKAVSLILLHNHPSGQPEPSPEDRALTERLQQVAQLVGVRILDHLVLGDQSYVSFADRGWI
ncbi:MAG: DNA repair protein RadC [Myxococcales bacterium]|nr:DNA repair protein RadC [Myxococcales bacterium]MCB9642295.1 DNA repair protein RadC [Myxococcales bacterium]